MTHAPSLLLIADDRDMPQLEGLLRQLDRLGVKPVVPQQLIRIGDSLVRTMDDLVGKATTMLLVYSAIPQSSMMERATYAFRARMCRNSSLKVFILPLGVEVPPESHGFAVVMPPEIAAASIAQLISTALLVGEELSTVRAPAPDNLNAPFLTAGAWPVSFAGGRSIEISHDYDCAVDNYWSGLNRSGYLSEWGTRLRASRALVRQAEQRGDALTRSLVLSKGLAYALLSRGQTRAATRALHAAGEAAHQALDGRARSYVLSYLGDAAAREGRIRDAVEAYEEAGSSLKGVENLEIRLKRDLLKVTSYDQPISRRISDLNQLQDQFSGVMNYRAGSVDILAARELAAEGLQAEALARLARGERFFTDIVPMPRNLRCARSVAEAVMAGLPPSPGDIPW